LSQVTFFFPPSVGGWAAVPGLNSTVTSRPAFPCLCSRMASTEVFRICAPRFQFSFERVRQDLPLRVTGFCMCRRAASPAPMPRSCPADFRHHASPARGRQRGFPCSFVQRSESNVSPVSQIGFPRTLMSSPPVAACIPPSALPLRLGQGLERVKACSVARASLTVPDDRFLPPVGDFSSHRGDHCLRSRS